ncbi:hypothetical protein AB0G73_35885 [Streptomyces sp. NPDC020719]|uniref:hypothetical protein n=1 Tax=Streptomyces sp. NPDC020719 TaxID=3154896 RepID=UPI0033D52DE5
MAVLYSGDRRTPPRRGRALAGTDATIVAAGPAAVWAAVTGSLGALPYVAMKVYWAWGGTAGKPAGMDLADEFAKNGAPRFLVWMERHGLDFTAIGILLAVTLLAALVRPWGQVFPRWVPGLRGRRVPRWLLLAPGWAVAATLTPYGGLGLVVIATGGLSAAHLAGLSPTVFVIGFVNFFAIGLSLGVCSLSYQRRTRRYVGRTADRRGRRTGTSVGKDSGSTTDPLADPGAGHGGDRERKAAFRTTPLPAPRWAVRAAHAAALTAVPSGLWRIALGFGLPVGYSDAELHRSFQIPGWGSVAVIGLSVVSEALALLTLGLVRPWGEVVPRWIPFIGGRRVHPLAAVIPAALGSLALMAIWSGFALWWSDEHHPAFQGPWRDIVGVCYQPLVLWGPLLAAVTFSYYRRHRA